MPVQDPGRKPVLMSPARSYDQGHYSPSEASAQRCSAKRAQGGLYKIRSWLDRELPAGALGISEISRRGGALFVAGTGRSNHRLTSFIRSFRERAARFTHWGYEQHVSLGLHGHSRSDHLSGLGFLNLCVDLPGKAPWCQKPPAARCKCTIRVWTSPS